jgi:TRAP-type mannitol/chloroaromatic compound transport system permease small subunit
MNAIDDPFGRAIQTGDNVLRPVEDLLNFIAAIAVMFLMLLGVVQVMLRMRWLFNAPIVGYIDMIELAMPILAVLGISCAQRYGVHIRMDILMLRMEGRRAYWVLETIGSALTFGIVVLLTRFSWVFFLDAYQIGDSTVDAELPTWPSKILVPIAFAILALRMLIQFLGALRLTLHPSLEPVGVVIPLDISEQAREEIREALGEEAAQ